MLRNRSRARTFHHWLENARPADVVRPRARDVRIRESSLPRDQPTVHIGSFDPLSEPYRF